MNLSILICSVTKEIVKKSIPDKSNRSQLNILNDQNKSVKNIVPIIAIYIDERKANRYDFFERKGTDIYNTNLYPTPFTVLK